MDDIGGTVSAGTAKSEFSHMLICVIHTCGLLAYILKTKLIRQFKILANVHAPKLHHTLTL